MHPEERLWLLERSAAAFLADPSDRDFMTVQTSTLPCNYAQLRLDRGELWGEVCSRLWDCRYCGNRPLRFSAVEAIAMLGFNSGAPHRNYEVHGLPRDTLLLAVTLGRVLITAYGEELDFEIGVYFKRRGPLQDLVALLRAHAVDVGHGGDE